MRRDVIDLARFYASPLGRTAQAMIARRLAALWPDARGLDVLGLGYAIPFLEPYRADARRAVAVMPAMQGVERWPADGANAAALVEEERLPFAEALFDRVLAVHLVEESEALRPLMRELWRVTAPDARIVVVAANRRGLWARNEASPFGHGRSFSAAQLRALLSDCMFEPTHWSRALYVPPVGWRMVTGAAETFEAIGERLLPGFGGVVLVEAVKRVGADARGGGKRFVFAPARPVPAPGPASAWRARNQAPRPLFLNLRRFAPRAQKLDAKGPEV
ncbi:MAG: methyltransferase domain-containing protein [Maricaulaceae bacterium]|jgi:SAM-dependent methyltransferase